MFSDVDLYLGRIDIMKESGNNVTASNLLGDGKESLKGAVELAVKFFVWYSLHSTDKVVVYLIYVYMTLPFKNLVCPEPWKNKIFHENQYRFTGRVRNL